MVLSQRWCFLLLEKRIASVFEVSKRTVLLSAGCCTALQLAHHIAEVGALHQPADIVLEGDAPAILRLALHRLVDPRDVDDKKDW